MSRPCRLLLAAILLTLLASVSLSLGAGLAWLSCLTVFSYIKLAITLVKYIPQAVANYRHKVRTKIISVSRYKIFLFKRNSCRFKTIDFFYEYFPVPVQ